MHKSTRLNAMILLAAYSICATATGQPIFWLNTSGDQDWANPNNWQEGRVPGALSPFEEAHIDPPEGVLWPIINSNVPTIDNMRLGVNANRPVPDRVDQIGGSITVNTELRIGEFNGNGGDAEYNLLGGTLNVGGGIRVGVQGPSPPGVPDFTARLNINGPDAVINAGFIAAPGFPDDSFFSEVNLLQGTVRINNLFAQGQGGITGVFNIADGVLSLAGLQIATVEFYIQTGYLVPLGNRTIVYDFGETTIGRTTVRAVFIRPGDYNGDGDVDAEDYNLWRTTFGSTTELDADGNGNGIVDAADYVVWRKDLDPGILVSGAQAPSVPEPSGLLISLLTLTISAALAGSRHPR